MANWCTHCRRVSKKCKKGLVGERALGVSDNPVAPSPVSLGVNFRGGDGGRRQSRLGKKGQQANARVGDEAQTKRAVRPFVRGVCALRGGSICGWITLAAPLPVLAGEEPPPRCALNANDGSVLCESASAADPRVRWLCPSRCRCPVPSVCPSPRRAMPTWECARDPSLSAAGSLLSETNSFDLSGAPRSLARCTSSAASAAEKRLAGAVCWPSIRPSSSGFCSCCSR